MEPSDAQLLESWRRGDRAAGEALMQRHYRSVLRFFELNASWAADDLAQRTFVACIERADAVRDVEAFRAYLLGIARRQLAEHQRELSHTRSLREFDAPQARREAAGLSTLLARGRDQLLLLRALAGLPRRPQALLILFYWEDVATPELAESYRVPVSTIRTRLARARDVLRRKMAELAVTEMNVPSDDELRELLLSVLSKEGSPRALGVGKR
jgi:RNA polymerase sigma-70 factor, ECF subfamily